MNDLAVVFDLDGVIVDTVETLYQVYARLVNDYGGKPSRTEFDLLNGPSLAEICTHLIKTHAIDVSHADLMRDYRQRIEGISETIDAVPDAIGTLKTLKALGFPLMLASSGSSQHVHDVVAQLDIASLFDRIITGDDVAHSKPDPEIYARIREASDKGQIVAIEDSVNGIAAAKGAGLSTLHFQPDAESVPMVQDVLKVPHQRIKYLPDILSALLPSVSHANILYPDGQLRLQESALDPMNIISPQTRQRIAESWENACLANNLLHDNQIICYSRHTANMSELVIEIYRAPYRYFWFKQQPGHENGLSEPERQLFASLRPIGVSAITTNSNNQVLLGKRSGKVSQYPEYWECVPSGTFNRRDMDPFAAIRTELAEETGNDPERINTIAFIGFAYDKDERNYDLNFAISVKSIHKLPDANEEYSTFKWVAIDQLLSKETDIGPCVPNTSLLALLHQHGALS